MQQYSGEELGNLVSYVGQLSPVKNEIAVTVILPLLPNLTTATRNRFSLVMVWGVRVVEREVPGTSCSS